MCLNNLHIRFWEFIWAETCIKNWRNAKTTWVPTAGWVSNRCLKNNISRMNHCLKHTIEDREKVTHKSVNLPLMRVSCSMSNSYIIFEKEGRFTCNHTHCTVSHKPRNVLQVQHHSMNVQLWLLNPSFTIKAHLKQNTLKGTTNLHPDTLQNLILLLFVVYLKTVCWMFLESRCANTCRKSKSCILISFTTYKIIQRFFSMLHHQLLKYWGKCSI